MYDSFHRQWAVNAFRPSLRPLQTHSEAYQTFCPLRCKQAHINRTAAGLCKLQQYQRVIIGNGLKCTFVLVQQQQPAISRRLFMWGKILDVFGYKADYSLDSQKGATALQTMPGILVEATQCGFLGVKQVCNITVGCSGP